MNHRRVIQRADLSMEKCAELQFMKAKTNKSLNRTNRLLCLQGAFPLHPCKHVSAACVYVMSPCLYNTMEYNADLHPKTQGVTNKWFNTHHEVFYRISLTFCILAQLCFGLCTDKDVCLRHTLCFNTTIIYGSNYRNWYQVTSNHRNC